MIQAAHDVTIRRCTLRVTRRGGWSWGADPRGLARRVVERLTALLESRLRQLAASANGDLEIREPVRLRIGVSAREWARLVAEGTDDSLAHRFTASLDSALTRIHPELANAAPLQARMDETLESRHEVPSVARDTPAPEATNPSASDLRALLQTWREAGVIVDRVCALSLEILRAWLRRLLETSRHSPGALLPVEPLQELLSATDGIPLLMPAGDARQCVRRLLFIVALGDTPVGRKALQGALISRWPLSAETPHDGADGTVTEGLLRDGEDLPGEQRATAARRKESSSPRERAVAPIREDFELDVPFALPFLLLGPLARAGYWQAVAATLDVVHAQASAPGIGMALARKVLPSPQRGWRRSADELLSAAAFTGRGEIDESCILDAGRALRPQLPVLDRVIADQLVAGHRAAAAWLLLRPGSGELLLVDEDGLSPMGSGSIDELAARVAPTGSPWFIDASAAAPELFDALDDLQIAYATRVNLADRPEVTDFHVDDGSRCWVSRHGGQAGRLRTLAGWGGELSERAMASWNALHDARPALRPGIDSALENSMSLAAAFALSAVAWALWPGSAQATAAAALERFADIDARVRVSRERIDIQFPMGRRAWALRDAGLLADVRGVPWLDGRIVGYGVG